MSTVFYGKVKQRTGTAIGTVLAVTYKTSTGSSISQYEIPTGYLACDGSSVSAAQYPALFDIIKNDYGGSASYNTSTKTYSGNFNLPDYRGRKLIGHGPIQDQGSGGTSNSVHSSSSITSSNYHGGTTQLSSASISGAFALASSTSASGHTGISVQQNTTVSGNISFTASAPSSFSHGLIAHNHPETAIGTGYIWITANNKNVNCARGGGGPSFHELDVTGTSTPDYSLTYDSANHAEDFSGGGSSFTMASSTRAHNHWLSLNDGGEARGSRTSNIAGDTVINGTSSAWSANVNTSWAAVDYISVTAITTTINSWTPQNNVAASINTTDNVSLVTPFRNALWVIKAY